MNVHFIIFVFFFLCRYVTSQERLNYTDADGMKQDYWEKRYPNGKLMYSGAFVNGKPVGKWKRYHENGVVKAILEYRPGTDSVFTSLFDDNGKIVARGNYLDEMRSGLWILFLDNRKIAEEQYSNGLKNGVSRKYYQTGELFEETEWLNGRQQGKARFFFKEGNPYLEMWYEDNRRNGLCISYFQSGAKELKASYKNDLKEGDWEYFDEQGNLLYILKYSGGILLNPSILDSIESKRFKEMENQRGKIPDPEEFLQNPAEYLRRIRNNN